MNKSRLQSPADVLVQLTVSDQSQNFIQPLLGQGRHGKGKSLVNPVAKQLEREIIWQADGPHNRLESLGCTKLNQQEQGEETSVPCGFSALPTFLDTPLDQLHETWDDPILTLLGSPDRSDG
jgi:hypothetical protein